MFEFFTSKEHQDAALGTLSRKHGVWRGQLALPQLGRAELRIAGTRKEPDAESLRLARRFPEVFMQVRDAIARALFEHYEPGLDAWRSGEFDGVIESFPQLSTSSDVWSHITIDAVDIDAGRNSYTTELRITAAWDQEHTLGVRLHGDQVVGLSGSVGP